MKATRLHAYGDVDQFKYEDAPDPVAGAGEVLVKLEASGINPVDLYVRMGYLAQRVPLELPAILGLDGAGTIAAVGADASGYKVGDRVMVKRPIGSKGTHAEFVAVPVGGVAKLQDNVSFVAAATLPLVGLTGRQGIDVLGVKPGERVLVTGALGAVGRAAVQYLKELGAVPVAGVPAERLAEGKALTGEAIAIGEGPAKSFAKALDTAGGAVAAAAAAMVRDGGTLSTVASVPEGTNADKRITITPVLAVDRAAMLQQVADAAGRGELSIPVAHTLKLSQLGEGHKLQAAGRTGGKIILVP